MKEVEAAAAHAVPAWVTALFAVLLVAMIGALAFEERLHARKSIISGTFATLALLLGSGLDILPFEPVRIAGREVPLPVWVPAIDWDVLGLLIGSSLFVDVTSQSGLFSWAAIRLTKASGGDPRRLLWSYGSMTVVFSALLNNVTAMILVGSLTVVSLGKLGRRDLLLGFLLTEGLLTNVGGMLTLISSVPNLLVGSAAGIGFGRFLAVSAPLVAMLTAGTLLIAQRLFRVRSLADAAARIEARRLVDSFDEREAVTSPGFFLFGSVLLAAFLLTVAFQSVLPLVDHLGLGFVALAFSLAALLRFRSEAERYYRAVDWDLIVFFAALFVVVNVLEHARVLDRMGEALAHVLGLGERLGASALLVLSSALSSVTDNIPLSAMLARILAQLEGVRGDPTSPFWWAVVFGANLGGNVTPIGSASTLVAVTIALKERLPLGFADFVRRAAPLAAAQVALSALYLAAVLA